MSEHWKYIWVMLFGQGLLVGGSMVAVGYFWQGVGVLVLAMLAFARAAWLIQKDGGEDRP